MLEERLVSSAERSRNGPGRWPRPGTDAIRGPMPSLSRKLDHFTESVIRRMTRVANASGAINLSQGFPDFDPPPELIHALERVARTGPHQYAITWGAADFRTAFARKQSARMD